VFLFHKITGVVQNSEVSQLTLSLKCICTGAQARLYVYVKIELVYFDGSTA